MSYLEENLCFINMDGSIIVEPRESYEELYFPSSGVCLVKRDGLFGYINMDGEVMIPVQYKNAYEFSDNGLAFVTLDNGLGGYINMLGELVIDAVYESGSMFEFGLAAVLQDGNYLFINEFGEEVINHGFKNASGFEYASGLAKVVDADGRHQLIDVDGEVKLSLQADCELDSFKHDTNVTSFSVDGKRALVNAEGEVITGLFDDIVISAGSELHPFLKNGLWGYLNNVGEIAIPNVYLSASEFSDYGVAKVVAFHPLADEKKVTLYINEQDMVVERRLIEAFNHSFADHFEYVYPFHNGLALALKRSVMDDDEYEEDWMDDLNEDRVEELEENPTTLDREPVRNSLYLMKIMFKQMRLPEILSLVSREFDDDILITTSEDHYIEFVCTVNPKFDLDELESFMDDILVGVDAYYHFRQLV